MADKKISELTAISGSATQDTDLFLMVDASAGITKKITRAELNNAIVLDILDTVDINGGNIDGTIIGAATPAAGTFTTLTANSGASVTGDITVSGNVDGRDVAADGTKLDGIEASATADQTGAEIATALNGQSITSLTALTTTGAVIVGGDLTVNGTTTTINSTTLTVDDKNIELASGAADAAAANGAGLTIDGATATFQYVATGDKWAVNKNFDVTGNIIVSGTVDGRDLQTDGTKLDGIESNATADQTAAEIRTLVESATDSNVFTDADHTKLNGIEASADVTDTANVTAAGALMDSEVSNLAAVKSFNPADYATAAQGTLAANALPKSGGTMTGNIAMSGTETVDGRDVSVDGAKLDGIETGATADQTGAEIKAAYEGESDTNAFTDALLTKLNGIEASATADQTAAEIRTLVESATDSNVFTDADHTKLNGIAANATAVTSLTDLSITDGSNGQVLATDGNGSFSFVNQSGGGGGGGTQDADGDTKIQVEESTDDDTIRFDTAGSERAVISSGGNIGIATTDLGFESLTIQKVGSSSYGSIQLRRSDTDGDNNGGILNFAQKDDCSTSWLGLAGWDNGSLRQVYIGGGGWGVEEATKVIVFAGAYDAGSGGAPAQLTIDANKVQAANALEAEGGGLILGEDAYSTSTGYVGMKTDAMTGANDYMIISGQGSTDPNTYISAKDGAGVFIRGGGNYSANQLGIPDGANPYFVGQLNIGTSSALSSTGQLNLYRSASPFIAFYSGSSTRGGYIQYITSGDRILCGGISNLQSAGNVTAYASDERLKKDFTKLENALEKVCSLEGVTYQWDKEKCESVGFKPEFGKTEIGLRAQQVEKVFPEVVTQAPFDLEEDGTSKSGDDYLTMYYERLTPVLVEAIKEQQAIIDSNQLDILQLKDEIKELKKAVSELKYGTTK